MKRVLAAALLVVIAVAGCGSTRTGSTSVDPATLAPPGALAFATFQIAPPGPEKADFEAAFGKLLGPAPEARLGAAFTEAASTSGKLDYLSDVRPWLGDTLSVVVTRVAPRQADFALLAASTDDAKAQAAIDKDLTGLNVQSRSYRDVSYKAMDDGTVNGVVAHFVVAGTESAFKAVVDTVKDGKSLTDSNQWKTTVGSRRDGNVGLAYLDVKGLLESFTSNLPGTQALVAPFLVGLADLHPIVATLAAQPDSLVVDVSSPGTKPDPRGLGAASSPLIESLPADSWLALAVPDVGQTLGKVANVLRSNPLLAAQYSAFTQRLRVRTGVDVDNDLLTLGDAGLFARGKSGTVVAQASKATLRRLRAFVEPQTQHHVRVSGPVSVDNRLGATPLFRKAAAAVGQRPTLFVDFGKALAIAAAAPHHRDYAHFEQALPHLRHIEFIAAGARREGRLDVARGVIGLR